MRITGGNQTHGHCVDPREEMEKGGARGVGCGRLMKGGLEEGVGMFTVLKIGTFRGTCVYCAIFIGIL